METRGASSSVVDSLHQARQQLIGMVKKYFSDYANQTMLWKSNQSLSVKPVSPQDPASVKFAKHCLLILQEAEELARRHAEFQEFKGTSVQFFKDRLVESIGKSMDKTLAQKTETHTSESKRSGRTEVPVAEEEVAPDQEFSIDLFNSLRSHLAAVVDMTRQMNLPESKQITDLVSTLKGISPQTVFAVKDRLANQFSNLSQAMSDLMNSYFNADRPLAPKGAEHKYETPKELEFKVLTATPANFNDFKPDSYLLIKEKEKWKVIYLDDKKVDYLVDWNDVWGLKKLLSKKSPEKLTQEDRDKIKDILSTRWNPSAQERSEWFLFVEPVRDVIRGSQELHELFSHFIQESKQKGILLDPEQVEIIEKTKKALRESKVDAKGYYLYLDEDEETPISQSLKGIYNVIWGINQLSRGYWENPGVLNQIHATEIGFKALDNYWKIQWPLLGGQLGVLYDQMINSFLVYGKQTAFPLLDRLARATHQVEMQHHLRYGVLTQEVRPLFDNLETLYVERGFDVSNPLGFSNDRKQELSREHKSSFDRAGELKQQLVLPTLVAEHLEFYKAFAPLVDKPDTLFRRMVSVKLPLMEKIENTVSLLLLELAQMRRENRFPKDVLAALDVLEEHLLIDLTLEKKEELMGKLSDVDSIKHKLSKSIGEDKKRKSEWEEKSYAQRARDVAGSVVSGVKNLSWNPLRNATPVPIAELQVVLDAVANVKKSLEEELHTTAKLEEALKQHEYMSTEYAERSLRKEGLNGLLRAIEAAKDNNLMNIKQKRRLVAILSDLKREDRVKNLAEAHTIAVQFMSNPAEIKRMIESQVPDIRHALAVEAMLTGYVNDFSDAALYTNNSEWLHQDLSNILDRMEAGQVLGLIKQVNEKNEVAIRRAHLFEMILTGDFVKPGREVKGEVKLQPITKDNLLDRLVQLYKKFEGNNNKQSRTFMNKIGMFIGRLALADKEVATTIFRGFPDAKKILQVECLEKNPALYYEAFVKIIPFNFIEGKHERENRSYEDFLRDNELAVRDMHAILYNDHKIDVREHYENPWKLCELIHTFNKNLSPGSDAEKSIKEFFSALVLCKDARPVRERMVDIQLEAKGSKRADYMELLTIPASYPFWGNVWDDLVKKENILPEFKRKAAHIDDLVKELDQDFQGQIRAEVKAFFEEQEKTVKSLGKKLPEKKDAVVQSKYLHQEMRQIQKNVDDKYQSWINIIVSEKKRADIHSLRDHLKQILDTLKRYRKDRKGFIAKLSKVRKDKLDLVSDYINHFKNIEIALLQNPDPHYKTYADQIIDTVAHLNEAHRRIIKDEPTDQKDQPVPKEEQKASPKRSGKLGEVMSSMTMIMSKLKLSPKADKKPEEVEELPPPDDLENRLGIIGEIILAIQKKLSSLMASPKKLLQETKKTAQKL